jgi:hypothetical protein
MIEQHSKEDGMGKYETVTVSGAGKPGEISVSPETATISWLDPAVPDSVRWVFDNVPEGISVLIKWDVESPFQNFGAHCLGDGRLEVIGTGNKGVGGLYRYSVLFVDGKQQIVAGVDPELENLPPPPYGGLG